MDRQIVYPGAIPLETDLLNTNKNTMIALSKQSLLLTGSTTVIHGLNCTPTSPASLVVNVGAGSIYSLQNIDSTAYSSLAADTTHNIPKQGLALNAQTFSLAAPSTSGQSVNYLIQATYQDVDSGSTVLPYYNAANPSVAWSGPANSGSAQNTVRSGLCNVTVKTGVAAATGMQSTPTPDVGYVGAWVVTVANGQTAITSSSISLAANAPFLPSSGLVAGIQNNSLAFALDTGTANSYVVSFSPPVVTLVDGFRGTFRAKNGNTTASTITVNGITNYPLYSHAQQALQGGEIVSNGLVEFEWNSALNAFVMCGNSGGAASVPNATQSRHAVNLGQLNTSTTGRLIGSPIIFSSSGTYTPSTQANYAIVEMVGGGGSGASGVLNGAGYYSGGGGGCSGTYIKFKVSVSNASPVTITVGAGGSSASGANGNSGGNTIFGTSATALGGNGGLMLTSTNSYPAIYGAAQQQASFGTLSGATLIDFDFGNCSGDALIMTNGARGGTGASSHLGGSTMGAGINSTGTNAATYGGGGAGTCSNSPSVYYASGNGAGGVVIIQEYA